MKIRPDLLDKNSPKGIEVIQLTSEKDVPSSHVYMESQVFTPDSKRFVLHRSSHSHGSDQHDAKHQYLLCDIEDSCRLIPITEELGVTAPSVTPDGRFMYYFVNETTLNGGRLILKRVGLDGTNRETIMVLDTALPGTRFRPSRIYSLSTISSDGRRLALPAFLGDGKSAEPPFGLMVFDLDKASVQVVVHGPTWTNMHPQYCRSTDPEASHDILIQEAHSYAANAAGEVSSKPDGKGTDIHVIRDDGTNFRSMPWGRDGNEFCQGHQCWRGRSTWAITSTHTHQPPEGQLIEACPVAEASHLGIKTPGGVRNELSREFPPEYFYSVVPDSKAGSSDVPPSTPLIIKAYFYHFATDIAGRRLISDSAPLDQGGRIFIAELDEAGRDPLRNFRYLLNPQCGPYQQAPKGCHIHPFLSPDGKMAFFNSNESGISQAYMIRGL